MKVPCAMCGGTGLVANYGTTAYLAPVPDPIIEFCPDCGGEGLIDQPPTLTIISSNDE